MPGYAFLATRPLKFDDIADHLRTLRFIGVPYTQEMIDNARADLVAQQNADSDSDGLAKRYPKAVVSNFAGDPARVTEMDALVAYLQMLGTLVDFRSVRPEQLRQ
jgi:cytochrome c oxidase cbb3-type subunit 2